MAEQNNIHNFPGMWGKLEWLESEEVAKVIPRVRREGFLFPVEPDTNVDDMLAILWHEFMAEPGSFLLTLRIQLRWDKGAFDRMTGAMWKCCKLFEEKRGAEDNRLQSVLGKVPRWLASGFWLLSYEARDWTSHPAWDERRKREPEYFNKAYEYLYDLAYWFFEGQCPWQDEEKGWQSTIVEI
jgi:hypothetical protein